MPFPSGIDEDYFMPATKRNRPETDGIFQAQYKKNKRIILATQAICALCGKPVDKSLKYPDPLSPCIDHIIPIAKGGHPADISNLQLAHLACNNKKADKLIGTEKDFKEKRERAKVIGNRNLPLSVDWANF